MNIEHQKLWSLYRDGDISKQFATINGITYSKRKCYAHSSISMNFGMLVDSLLKILKLITPLMHFLIIFQYSHL